MLIPPRFLVGNAVSLPVPVIGKYLYAEDWNAARSAAIEARKQLDEAGYRPDGLLIKAGESWLKRFVEFGLADE
jgi:hypothetical protein